MSSVNMYIDFTLYLFVNDCHILHALDFDVALANQLSSHQYASDEARSQSAIKTRMQTKSYARFFVVVISACLFIIFEQGPVLGGRTPPSPTQDSPFPLYSASPRRIL